MLLFSLTWPRRFAAWGSVFFSAVVGAQVPELEPVVVSASRLEQKLSDTLPHTTVFTRTDIEQAQVSDVLSLIARAAGVEVAPLGGVGAQAGLMVRGAPSRHVLVLIDGVPLNNLNFSLAALDQLMVGQIERIEVVRGNLSSLYGSQAVGGLVQIFTRGAARTEPGVSASARVATGTHSTHEQAVALEGATVQWRYAVSATHFETEGVSAIDPAKRSGVNPDRDGYRNRSGSALVGYTWAPGHEVVVRALGSRGRLQYDSEFGPASQPDESEQKVESVSLALSNQLTAAWRSKITVSQLRDALDAPVTAFPYFVTSRSRQTGWQNEVRLTPDWTATAAVEHLAQDIQSDTTYGRNGRTVDALRLGLVGRIGAHQAQLNARHDNYSDFGEASTGYLGYGYAVSEVWRAFASVSSAFNAPTFNDLFFPFGGNSALRPERARSRELGVQGTTARWRVRSALFDTRYSDLIGNDSSFNRANIGRASVQGLELSVQTQVRSVRVAVSATAQDARDDTTDTRLIRRAHAFGNVQLARAFGAVDAQLNWRLMGARTDQASGQTYALGGYGLLDLALRWKVDEHWAATARLSNALDQRYENAWGYPGGGRAVLLGLEARR